MAYTLEELNPSKPVLSLDSRKFTISFVTLQHQVIFIEEYGSLTEALEKLDDEPMLIIKYLWILLEEKSQFDNEFSNFAEYLKKVKEDIVEWSQKMGKVLGETINKSMPLVRNQQRQNDIKKINAATDNGDVSGKVCYAVYFDSIAKRYGAFTLEVFYNLTLRQLHMMLETVGDEKHKELEVLASLNDKKLAPRLKMLDIDPELEAEQEADALDAVAELERKYQENLKAKEAENGK